MLRDRTLGDVDALMQKLSLAEKVELLAGQGSFRTTGLPERNIPALLTSDGPHGIRGVRSFERHPSCLFPSATAMGATFDEKLLRQIGHTLGDEARSKGVHILLAPTVCLQRSPLLGRGFEAFGEDPVLSGVLGAAYVNGVQAQGVATSIKHYAAHDQSTNSIEDNVCMTERTLRELHCLPFEIALSRSNPWTFMTAYHKINGVHVSEDPVMMQKILREELGFEGLILSDWWGTYSTTEALNAGLDLEMPGPSIFRGSALLTAVNCRKVPIANIDRAVQRVLELTQKVTRPSTLPPATGANTHEGRAFVRKVAAESIVLLKNEKNILPLKSGHSTTYGLIGDHFLTPALSGGGSAAVDPYYSVTPYDAMIEVVGEDAVKYQVGAYSFKFSPLLRDYTIPGTSEQGWTIEIFEDDPSTNASLTPLYTTSTAKPLIDVPESFHKSLPATYYARAITMFRASKACKYRFGFTVAGLGRFSIDDKLVINQWEHQLPKTDDTPNFNRHCMEKFYDLDVAEAQQLKLELVLVNKSMRGGVGTALTLSGRVGGFEVIDKKQALQQAVDLAKNVDNPIVVTGLSSDYEYEAADRKHLRLPEGIDELIATVAEANPNTIIVTQSGLPIEMPWISKISTLLHAWFGGQETGHGLTDVLFGKVNPSARLPITFPRALAHTPSFLTFGKADRDIMYGEGVFIGHRYYEKVEREPLFYFGYGLSYTQFTLSDLTVSSIFEPRADFRLNASVRVENVGQLEGAETVQVYVQDSQCAVQRPIRELKAFAKTAVLKAGESQEVVLSLDKYAVSYWDEESHMWKAEAGDFDVIVARSANPRDEVLRATFKLEENFYWNGV